MNLHGKRVLVTGAAGGIGAALVTELLAEGASVLLTGRHAPALQRVIAKCGAAEDRAAIVPCDLTRTADRARLCEIATRWQGGIDILINNAAVSEFGLLSEQSGEALDTAVTTNLVAPMDLCRRLEVHLVARPAARIVNIGSVFGSIGFAGNAIYSGTKFGLRGFSEALRRELADTRVRVHYIAPRATRTALNSSAAERMNAALGNAMDDSGEVARQIISTLRQERLERVLGWPENVFARINALLPRVVDKALYRQLDTIRQYAQRPTEHKPRTQSTIMFDKSSRRVG